MNELCFHAASMLIGERRVSKAIVVVPSDDTECAHDMAWWRLNNYGVECLRFAVVGAVPTKSEIEAGAQYARDNGCGLVIALGDGTLEAAHQIAMMATNDGNLWDYVSGGTGKGLSVVNEPLPAIALCGDAVRTGVIVNDETGEVAGASGSHLQHFVVSAADPELLESTPPKLSAFQGFDMLFRAVGSYISALANPVSDMYALNALEYVGKYMVRAVKDCGDMDALGHMAFANAISGAALPGRITSAAHALEEALSACHPNLPRGAGSIMVSKALYERMIESESHGGRFVTMACALGMAAASKPGDFIAILLELQAKCGVGGLKMADYGIAPEELGAMAGLAYEIFDAKHSMLSYQDCAEILNRSFYN